MPMTEFVTESLSPFLTLSLLLIFSATFGPLRPRQQIGAFGRHRSIGPAVFSSLHASEA